MDGRLYLSVNRFASHTAWAHPIVRAYAKDGIVLFAVLLVAGWWLARSSGDHRAVAAAVWAGVAAAAGLAANQLVGHLVERSRPYVVHPTAHLLVARTSDFSFPSDHAVVAGAVAAGLLVVDRRLGLVASAAALAMAFARVYVGAHYPGDVAAGITIGAAIAFAGRPVAQHLGGPVVARLARSRMRPLVVAG